MTSQQQSIVAYVGQIGPGCVPHENCASRTFFGGPGETRRASELVGRFLHGCMYMGDKEQLFLLPSPSKPSQEPDQLTAVAVMVKSQTLGGREFYSSALHGRSAQPSRPKIISSTKNSSAFLFGLT